MDAPIPSLGGHLAVPADARLVAICVGAITLAVFFPSVACDFVNVDDPKYIEHNPLVPEGLTPTAIERAWTEPVFHNWAPLTIMSLQLDVTLFGLKPWGFHLTNVLLHAASAAVVCLAWARMTGAVWRSAAAALLFAVHPLRVESVTWIAERKDVLSVFLLALALLAYEWYCRRPSVARYAALSAAMLGSLLAKATAVTLPVLLLILDAWPLARIRPRGSANLPSGPRVVREKLPLFLLSAIFIGITLWSQREALQPESRLPLLTVRVPNAVVAVGRALWETAVPLRLHPAHRHPGSAGIDPVDLLAATVLIAVLVAVAWRLRREVPACPAGIAWFFVALSPVLGIVAQQGFQSRADRFTYVPHIGLMVAVVWTAAFALPSIRLRPLHRPRWRGAVLLWVAAGACVVASRAQIDVWRDSISLWRHVLAIEPANPVAHLCLGEALYERGDGDEAIAEFRRALALEETARAHNWLGLALAQRGMLAEAYAEHAAATLLDPDDAEAHNNAGIALARSGRMPEALARFTRAAELMPDDPEIRQNLARARAELERAIPR